MLKNKKIVALLATVSMLATSFVAMAIPASADAAGTLALSAISSDDYATVDPDEEYLASIGSAIAIEFGNMGDNLKNAIFNIEVPSTWTGLNAKGTKVSGGPDSVFFASTNDVLAGAAVATSQVIGDKTQLSVNIAPIAGTPFGDGDVLYLCFGNDGVDASDVTLSKFEIGTYAGTAFKLSDGTLEIAADEVVPTVSVGAGTTVNGTVNPEEDFAAYYVGTFTPVAATDNWTVTWTVTPIEGAAKSESKAVDLTGYAGSGDVALGLICNNIKAADISAVEAVLAAAE